MVEDRQTLSAYAIKGKGKTSIISEKLKKARDSYVCIYESGKQFFTSTSEHACTAQETAISQIK